MSLLLAVLRPPLDKSWRAYYAAVGRDAATSMRQLGLAIVFLPHQAFVSADAIVRTLWRMAVSHRHLLEWRTASQIERGMTDSARVSGGGMWPAVALAGGGRWPRSCGGGDRTGPGAAPWWLFALAVVPLLAAWLAAPSVAQALGAPAERRDRRLPPDSRRQALRYALLHWRFFDRFVTAESAWLAPDNFQETPEPVVALRTSPTNVGLQLLATVSAFDLGFVSLDDMLRRLELVFRTLERMRRFRGHLYNWYDLRDLSVMEPAYVSTVDSGNLAGHLIALRQACLGLADGPIVDPRIWHALDTSLTLADERLLALPNDVAAREQLRAARAALALAGEPVTAAALGAISAPLASAEAALASAGLAPEVLAPAIEWITWSRRLAESQGELLGGFDAAPAESLRRLAPTWADAASFITRLETLADRAATFAMEMDFRFLFDGEREAVRDRLPAGHPLARRLVLRSPRLGVAAGELHGDRQERRSRGALVPARPPADLRRGGAGAGVMERQHVRVPDADAGDALLPRHRARADLRGRARAAGGVRRRAERALGRERERLQRARPPPDLSVPAVRGARSGAQARPGPRAGGGTVCVGARDHDRPPARARQPGAARGQGHTRSLRLPRRARLHPPR